MDAGQVYYVSYVVGNELSNAVDLGDPCLAVAIGQPIVFFDDPLVDAGDDMDVCGFEFNLTANAPTTGGTWSLLDFPIGALTDIQIITGQSIAAVDLPGTYIFELEVTDNGCTGTDEVVITFIDSPSPVSVLTVCDGDSYTVEFQIQGGEAPYIVNGDLLTSDQFLSQSINSGDVYFFTISDGNGCQGEVITGTKLCDCETFSGTMPSTTIEICAVDGTSLIASSLGDAIFDANDTGIYILHTGASNILGDTIATSDTPNFIYDSSFGTDLTLYISYVVGDSLGSTIDLDDPCLSVSVGVPVVISPLEQTDAGDYITGCEYYIDLSADDQGTPGMWSIVDSPLGAVTTFVNASDATTNLTVDLPGDYDLAWIPIGNDCVLPDMTTITFDSILMINNLFELCSDDLTTFQISVDISGGVSPYFVNGIEISSNYMTPPISSSDPYSFIITDSKGCEFLVEGTVDCDCENAAGTMDLTPLVRCISDTLLAIYNEDALATTSDDEYFVVHDSNTDDLGNIFGIYNTNEIFYQPSIVLGQTYYVSHVLGNTVSGILDLNSPCLQVSIGQPIVFEEIVEIFAGQNTSICGLTSELTGQGPTDLSYNWNMIASPFGAIVSLPLSAISGTVEVDRSGIYLFEISSDNGSCTSRDTVRYEFVEPLIVNNINVNCMNDGYTVSWEIEGGGAPYSVEGTLLTGSAYESPLIPLGEDYSFIVSDESMCDDIIVEGTDTCECDSEAGSMNLTPILICEDESITPDELTLGDYIFDEDDAAIFVVHTLDGEALGDILSMVLFNSFDPIIFDALLYEYNTTYYVSLVVGNANGTTIDYADPCISVSSGTPFSWVEKVSVTIEGGGEGCSGDFLPINVISNSDLPIEIVLSSSDNELSTYLIEENPQTILIEVTQSENLELFDIVGIDCKDISSPEVSVTLIENESLELASEVVLCIEDLDEVPLDLTSFIENGDDTGEWFLDGELVSASLEFSSFTVGQYTLEYNVDGLCSPQSAFINFEIEECQEPCPTYTFSHEDVSCFGLDDGEIRLFTDEVEINEDVVVSINNEEISSYPLSDLSPGIYEVILVDQTNCVDSFSIVIMEPDAVSVALGDDMDVEINDPVTIEAITNLIDESIDGVTWSSLQGIFEESGLLLTTTFENDDVISITIIDENGCSGMDDIMVRVDLAEIYIPNVFNPNSSSGNNTFGIKSNVNSAIINQLQIYDRWGNKVFGVSNISPSDPAASWDGRHNDRMVGDGVYVYYLEVLIGNEVVQKIGDITVVK